MILFAIVLCSLVGVLGCIFDYQLQELDKRITKLEKRVELLEDFLGTVISENEVDD